MLKKPGSIDYGSIGVEYNPDAERVFEKSEGDNKQSYFDDFDALEVRLTNTIRSMHTNTDVLVSLFFGVNPVNRDPNPPMEKGGALTRSLHDLKCAVNYAESVEQRLKELVERL